jgi:hypothetical protein
VGDNVFQVIELVEPYWVVSSIDLEENSNFHFFDNNLIDVDTKKLNVVLSSSGQAQVNEDDDGINVEDCDEADDDSIEERDNSD